MKTFNLVLILFATFYGLLCNAQTWTSVDGETMEGKLIRYNPDTEEITIERSYDHKIFTLPETRLIISDRIKAIRLQNDTILDYWYTNYEEAKANNPNKSCLILYLNNAYPIPFELFYTKLLLRKDFIELLRSRRLIVCVPETIPDEVGLIKYQTVTAEERESGSRTANDEWKTKRIEEFFANYPMALIADFSSSRSGKMNIVKGWEPLYQPAEDPNPFLKIPEDRPYIALKDVENYIRELNSSIHWKAKWRQQK